MMATPRQALRQKIVSNIDTMIADLNTIKHHALSMDEIAVLTVGKSLTSCFNKLLVLYRTRNDRILVPDRRIKKPDELMLG